MSIANGTGNQGNNFGHPKGACPRGVADCTGCNPNAGPSAEADLATLGLAVADASGHDSGHDGPDLTAWTPTDVDTELARLYGETARLSARRNGRFDMLTREVARRIFNRGFGGTATAQEVQEAIAEIEQMSPRDLDHQQHRLLGDYRMIADLDASIEDLKGQMEPLNAEFERRGGWSRAFLVTNGNGHVHSSMQCSTCRPTTEYHWVTEMSGKDETDIVEAAGERACTVCYPSAPVETLNRATSLFTPDEIARAKAREEREAARVERERKRIEKALLPTGEPLKVSLGMRPGQVRMPDGSWRWKPDAAEGFETFKTLSSARSWLTDAKVWGEGHPSYPSSAVGEVAEAVAAKEGKSVDQVLEEAAKRAERRR